MSLNKVMIIGRLGNAPELKHTPSGSSVCNFSVATSEFYNDNQGQRQEKTEWHRIVVWGKNAENCHKYLDKGRQCYIEGKMQTRSWEDKEGNKRYTTEVVALNVQFLGGRADNQGASPSAPSSNNTVSSNNSNMGTNNSQPQNDFSISPNQNFAADDIPF